MNCGRPKDFDRKDVLQKAVDVFWKQGYQATSIDDLLDKMEIGRQSLYNTFGGKEALFREVIDHYHATVSSNLLSLLQAEGSPLENIKNLFVMILKKAGDKDHRGCLMVNTAIEFAGFDRESEVLKSVRKVFSTMEKELKKTLQQAVDAGELSAEQDINSQATFLAGSIQGIMLMAKTGASQATLQRMADGILMTLQ
ncbi:hypothetical protein MNBD_PLANCTO02-2358 [hydrothermal vent metagenome]|uniref:HTH tetR-type domain-containing protein n=1 Tax=hydrothermal vent metagenome TaxID=652676 RepID=A0A3B1DKF1_9ZZZZ